MSIGKGVVGSSDETKGRKKVPWQQGSACFLPQNGGKALGWVHVTSKDDAAEEPVGHAIMYSIKIPPQELEKKQEEIVDSPEWVQYVVAICMKQLKELTGCIDSDNNTATQDPSAELSKDDTHNLRKIIDDLLKREKVEG